MRVPSRFLLVDNKPPDRFLAQEALAELCPDCHRTEVSDTSQTLTHLAGAEELPEVLLLDVKMQRMNGFEVLQTLKEDPRLRLIPVVVPSSSSAWDLKRAVTCTPFPT
ncbi:response regulator [Deinococcus sp. PEB2-63]